MNTDGVGTTDDPIRNVFRVKGWVKLGQVLRGVLPDAHNPRKPRSITQFWSSPLYLIIVNVEAEKSFFVFARGRKYAIPRCGCAYYYGMDGEGCLIMGKLLCKSCGRTGRFGVGVKQGRPCPSNVQTFEVLSTWLLRPIL